MVTVRGGQSLPKHLVRWWDSAQGGTELFATRDPFTALDLGLEVGGWVELGRFPRILSRVPSEGMPDERRSPPPPPHTPALPGSHRIPRPCSSSLLSLEWHGDSISENTDSVSASEDVVSRRQFSRERILSQSIRIEFVLSQYFFST